MSDTEVKELLLVRHAQGQHNVGRFEFDPPLTEEGRRQCLRGRKPRNLDLIVVSPLRRTIQTALLLLPTECVGPNVPIIAYEGIREQLDDDCNFRRPIEVQSRDFPEVDFSLIPPGEDSQLGRYNESAREVQARAVEFLRWLAARPERRIAVVTHFEFLLHGLMPALFAEKGACVRSNPGDDDSYFFDNCETRSLKWRPKGRST